jgi:hypothetical protein
MIDYVFYATSVALPYPVPRNGKAMLLFRRSFKKELFPMCILNRHKPHAGINIMYNFHEQDTGFTVSGNCAVHVSGFLVVCLFIVVLLVIKPHWKSGTFPKIELRSSFPTDLYYRPPTLPNFEDFHDSPSSVQNFEIEKSDSFNNNSSFHFSTPVSSLSPPKSILKKSPPRTPPTRKGFFFFFLY